MVGYIVVIGYSICNKCWARATTKVEQHYGADIVVGNVLVLLPTCQFGLKLYGVTVCLLVST